jgi:hypothetical protein
MKVISPKAQMQPQVNSLRVAIKRLGPHISVKLNVSLVFHRFSLVLNYQVIELALCHHIHKTACLRIPDFAFHRSELVERTV